MDTSDLGLMDVERFDLGTGPAGAARPGWPRGRGEAARDGHQGQVPIVLAIIDERLIVRGWRRPCRRWRPRSAAGPGTGLWGRPRRRADGADTARRILLGEHTESGRYYVDPADIIANGHGLFREPAEPPRRRGSHRAGPAGACNPRTRTRSRPAAGREAWTRTRCGGSRRSPRWLRPDTTTNRGGCAGARPTVSLNAGTIRPGTCPIWTSNSAPPCWRSARWSRTSPWPPVTSGSPPGRAPGPIQPTPTWSARWSSGLDDAVQTDPLMSHIAAWSPTAGGNLGACCPTAPGPSSSTPGRAGGGELYLVDAVRPSWTNLAALVGAGDRISSCSIRSCTRM